MTEALRIYRLKSQYYNLVGEECVPCGEKLFPPRDVCLECKEVAAQKEFTFSGKGEVYSHSTIYQAPAGYEEYVPYTVALVKLEEGPLVTSQLTDIEPDNVEIGMPVEMVTRKLFKDGDEGLIVYGYKFRPQLTPTIHP